jgi:hypothetical protein
MQKNLQVRIVKRKQRASLESPVEVACADRAVPSEREMKAVVAGWVSEHRAQSEEYGRAFASLFTKVEMRTPQTA